MQMIEANGLHIHIRDEGPRDGLPVVFANSLGTDLRLWEPMLPHLPPGLRLIRYDKRGHGLSDCPPGPYAMGALIRDAEAVMETLAVQGALFVGLSIGGLIAQGLAVKRPDLIRALVLSNTATRIGTPALWQERIDTVHRQGIAALADATMERWFSAAFRATPALQGWRNMLIRQPAEGYAGCCAAISGADFLASSAGLRLPVLTIAGSEDGSTPPDMLRELAAGIPGAEFALMRGAGHLPCVEQPQAYAALLAGMIDRLP